MLHGTAWPSAPTSLRRQRRHTLTGAARTARCPMARGSGGGSANKQQPRVRRRSPHERGGDAQPEARLRSDAHAQHVTLKSARAVEKRGAGKKPSPANVAKRRLTARHSRQRARAPPLAPPPRAPPVRLQGATPGSSLRRPRLRVPPPGARAPFEVKKPFPGVRPPASLSPHLSVFCPCARRRHGAVPAQRA